MKNRMKIIGLLLVLLLVVVIVLVWFRPKDYDPVTMYRAAPIGTGYAAKMLCSGVFVSGRQPDSLWNEDLSLMRNNLIRGTVDYTRKSAEAHILGIFFKQTALYRGPCGCTLEMGVKEDEFKQQCPTDLPAPPTDQANSPWPIGDAPSGAPYPAGIDKAQLNQTLDWAFSEPNPAHLVRTRAVLVLYDGQIVAERYAPGFSQDTRLIGWSMSKSVTSALIGILVRQGKLDLHAPAPVPEWKAAGDPRGKITLDQLLHMNSGLKFVEEYEDHPDTDAGFMYFTVKDMAAYAANKPLEARPGKKFYYSSGTTMILSRIVRQTVGGSEQDYLAFPRQELFNKLGMRSVVVEPDPSGTMVGAGFTYATARDWARFGLLYYNDGVWNGERILPEGWVEYTRTPAPSSVEYGVQFWLNPKEKNQWMPDCPTDIYSAWGHEGQFVTIVPSRKTIIVRLGQTFDADNNWNHNYFVSHILKALPE